MSFFGTNDAEDGQDRSSELVVILTNPESCNVDERDCPITMERFDKSDVDFLPGARVIPSRPSLCVAVLPCGHKFGAVPLIYHMLRSGMRCPCCRAGCGSLLDPGSIPSHIRDPMLRHCNRMRWRELDEQQAGEAQVQPHLWCAVVPLLQLAILAFLESI